MKTLFRLVLSLTLIVWVGAEIFFPIVAATTFGVLAKDTHTAGAIVGSLLRTMHHIGLVAGIVALVVLALAPLWGFNKPRFVLVTMAMIVVMMACTVYSQYGIIPAMERDRKAAGGAIDQVAETNPARVHFNSLHKQSVRVEGAVLVLGLSTVVLLAYAEANRGR